MGIAHSSCYVMEFPKSGGSWVRRMAIAMVEQSAARRGHPLPPVVHNHWQHTRHLRPAVYVVRDGRDVIVSLYFYHLRDQLLATPKFRHADRYFRRILGLGYELDDVRGNLPAFIRSLTDHPFGGILRRSGNRRFLPWPAHVAEWRSRPGVLEVRYERLLEDSAGELTRIADHLALDIEPAEVVEVARRYQFNTMTGRRPGQEDRSSFLRKGIAGDWKNHFTRRAGEAFLDFAGQSLIELGYAPDDSWVDSLPRV